MDAQAAIHIEQMNAGHEASVSRLLLQAFRSKFQLGAGLNDAQLQLLLEQFLVLDEQWGNGQRLVAIQEGSVIGTLSLQFQTRSAEAYSKPRETDLQPLWKGLGEVGWGKALAFALRLACLDHRPARGEMYIADVSVHEKFRGAGVGKTMLEWGLREAALRPGIRYASLHVSGHNLGAKRLYERLGFRTLEAQHSTLMAWLFGEQEWHYMVHQG